jgi:hypothetical protein
MNRTITRSIAIGAASLACVALTTVACASAALASIGPFPPPETHLASTYTPQATIYQPQAGTYQPQFTTYTPQSKTL